MPAGHFITVALIKVRFPDPDISTVKLPASSVVILFFSRAEAILKFPTAPLNSFGIFVSGKGFTFITTGSLLVTIF